MVYNNQQRLTALFAVARSRLKTTTQGLATIFSAGVLYYSAKAAASGLGERIVSKCSLTTYDDLIATTTLGRPAYMMEYIRKRFIFLLYIKGKIKQVVGQFF